MNISERYRRIREEVDRCCRDAGRSPDEVKIIAVSKTVEVPLVEIALDAGISDFGENRPDSLLEKHAAFPHAVWHFIGNVQSRRIPDIISSASLVHSVYKPSHLAVIDKEAKKMDKRQDILVEVNISAEKNKGGLQSEEVEAFLEIAEAYPNIKVVGMMTMAPQGDLKLARECFMALAQLQDRVRQQFAHRMAGQDLRELSMGMSEDWREAIVAGTTMVRIGRAIFDDAFGAH